MKALLLIAVFVIANVVGAGVWLVFGLIISPAVPAPFILTVVGILSVGCAILFVIGSIDTIGRLQFYKRRGGQRG